MNLLTDKQAYIIGQIAMSRSYKDMEQELGITQGKIGDIVIAAKKNLGIPNLAKNSVARITLAAYLNHLIYFDGKEWHYDGPQWPDKKSL